MLWSDLDSAQDVAGAGHTLISKVHISNNGTPSRSKKFDDGQSLLTPSIVGKFCSQCLVLGTTPF